ncbi:GntR family transcriptional regulator [Rhizorhabdus sp. FW153]|uniref:GntR family transcriptional regulator n=1 Tax=Rhizorhabdus sp. FW153 TaxID=3400216 RepID=UPI003CF09D07
MNPGATTQRVYEALKQRILTLEFRPGDRLDPAILSDSLTASVTPVRDALHMLAGEQLVEARTANGFFLPPLDEPALKDLYRWSSDLLMLAIRNRRQTTSGSESAVTDRVATVAETTAKLFGAIARQSTNREHERAVARLSERLHAVRLAEARIIDAIEPELAGINEAFTTGRGPDLARACAAYHRRRERVAGLIVRAVYRGEAR